MATDIRDVEFTHIRFPDDVRLLAPADVALMAETDDERLLLERSPALRRMIASFYNTMATGKVVLVQSPLLPSREARIRRSRAASRAAIAAILARQPDASLTMLARMTKLSRSYCCALRREVMPS